jgi:hypothetical protein
VPLVFGKKRRAADAAQRALRDASERVAFLEHAVDQAEHFAGVTGAEAAAASSLPLKAGENLLCCVDGAALIEPRRAAGHWEGRSQGLSVPVPGLSRVRYRIGATHGTYVQGDERPTPIDTGAFTITTTRAVFMGMKQTREWAWSKLLGISHAADSPWTAIAVSNRQKTSGVLYGSEHEDLVRFNIDLAVAIATGARATLVGELTDELAEARKALAAGPH